MLAILAHRRAYFGWDIAVASRMQRVSALLPLMELVSLPGYGWGPYLLTITTAVLFLIARKTAEVAGLIGSCTLGGLLNAIAKQVVGRPRPPPSLVAVSHALLDGSFPSGHVMFYCTYFGFLAFLAHRSRPRSPSSSCAMVILAAIPIILVGPSRVYLGEHWPSDVLGAYLLAGPCLALAAHAYVRWTARGDGKLASQRGIGPR